MREKKLTFLKLKKWVKTLHVVDHLNEAFFIDETTSITTSKTRHKRFVVFFDLFIVSASKIWRTKKTLLSSDASAAKSLSLSLSLSFYLSFYLSLSLSLSFSLSSSTIKSSRFLK